MFAMNTRVDAAPEYRSMFDNFSMAMRNASPHCGDNLEIHFAYLNSSAGPHFTCMCPKKHTMAFNLRAVTR